MASVARWAMWCLVSETTGNAVPGSELAQREVDVLAEELRYRCEARGWDVSSDGARLALDLVEAGAARRLEPVFVARSGRIVELEVSGVDANFFTLALDGAGSFSSDRLSRLMLSGHELATARVASSVLKTANQLFRANEELAGVQMPGVSAERFGRGLRISIDAEEHGLLVQILAEMMRPARTAERLARVGDVGSLLDRYLPLDDGAGWHKTEPTKEPELDAELFKELPHLTESELVSIPARAAVLVGRDPTHRELVRFIRCSLPGVHIAKARDAVYAFASGDTDWAVGLLLRWANPG